MRLFSAKVQAGLKNRHVQNCVTLGLGLGVVSHILNPFQISLEFERETPLLTLVQSPGLHQLSLVILRGAALAGTRVHTVLIVAFVTKKKQIEGKFRYVQV